MQLEAEILRVERRCHRKPEAPSEPVTQAYEPFLQLADLGAEEALIAWGGFYFRRGDSSHGEWRIVDDEELRQVAGERSGTIGASSEPYGEAAVGVERDGVVVARAEMTDRNYECSALDPVRDDPTSEAPAVVPN